MMDKVESFLNYIENRPVYDKLLWELRKKYESLGEGKGSIVLYPLTRQEREQLQGLFGVNPYDEGKVIIRAKDFDEILQQSRFAGITVKMILELHFGVEMKTKREVRDLFQTEFETSISEFLLSQAEVQKEQDSFKSWFTEQIGEKHNLLNYLRQKFREGVDIQKHLAIMQKAINNLTIQRENDVIERMLLPVFAAEVSGNPHYFDSNTIGEKILLDYIRSIVTERKERETCVEEKWELFYAVGLLKDEVTNSVLVYGIRGLKKDGAYHQGLDGFYKEKEPIQVMLRTLSSIVSLHAQGNAIYIVENPAIFTHLIEQNPKRIVICTSGQLCLSGLLTLDLLVKSNYQLYYAGDFDPEGLQIADKLKQRYGKKIIMWGYTEENYVNAISEVAITEERLRKLDSIKSEDLLVIVKLLREYGKAGYQERIVRWFV